MARSTQRGRTATNSQSRQTGMSGSRIAGGRGSSARGGNRAAMGPQTIRGAAARMVNTPTSGTSGR